MNEEGDADCAFSMRNGVKSKMRQAKIYPAECIGIIAFDPNTYNESIFHPEMKDVLYMERKCYEKMIRENVKIEEKENPFSLQCFFRLFSKKTNNKKCSEECT